MKIKVWTDSNNRLLHWAYADENRPVGPTDEGCQSNCVKRSFDKAGGNIDQGGKIVNAYKPLIISYYQQGIYNKDDLALFVSVGWISQAEVDELVKQVASKSQRLFLWKEV